ncbi:E3 ubiquitin protein ligase DRIP2-like [Syzygium oleosum]|uniref:E3 ubiquitin protein ligase DRIP2-like n=1 Tax=Syzygium oleosum TaxID=219896 RepID=UPI0011D2B0F8|nr:E3 ubiquitin protein ligase DRIP2-like [Syzygium oleosum]
MAGQAVKVKRETIKACMTCPLCNKLLKEATTISLCLHTFCRKCIYEKLSDDEVDCCPVCKIDLGCLPVEKLRPDHNLQDIRAKVFPLKRRKVKAPEITPPVPLPIKRKERSLSSLVVSAPKVSIQSGLTGRRTKSVTRRAASSRASSFAYEEPNKKEEDSTGDCAVGSSSPDSSNKTNKGQESSPDKPYDRKKPAEDTKDGFQQMEGKFDLWTPLNCLVEAANRTKSSKSSSHGLSLPKLESLSALDREPHVPEKKAKEELPDIPKSGLYLTKSKTKDHALKTKFQDDKKGIPLSGPIKRKRMRATGQKKAAASEELSTSAQLLLDASSDKHDRRNYPIWFSLIASEDLKGEASLPQISSCYLRIKDGNVPVSIIQKYLVKKLQLTSEAEVEILCRGQPVLPTLLLNNLVDLWFRTAASSKRVTASVGTSAKEFVMVLSYCRKIQAP